MAYKDIMVYLDAAEGSGDRLRLAATLAKMHGARLIGVDANLPKARNGDDAGRVGAEFEAATRTAGLSAQFIDSEAPLARDQLQCVDLIVASRAEGETRKYVRDEVPEGLLHEAGAPVLILPQEWTFGPVGEKVVIAWNTSREALRAVHEAMPLLEKAQKVTIFAFSGRHGDLRASSQRLADHLGRHGVATQISEWSDSGETSAIEALFADLDTQDADLIVAGAFGHSRLSEMLFGSVSLDLLRQPTAPIFMSH
ncbi:MAG: universal stress protein [Bradyrhizobium sp.]|nr:MAG: universal stress protein [Bradyrhizobium sp.]